MNSVCPLYGFLPSAAGSAILKKTGFTEALYAALPYRFLRDKVA